MELREDKTDKEANEDPQHEKPNGDKNQKGQKATLLAITQPLRIFSVPLVFKGNHRK